MSEVDRVFNKLWGLYNSGVDVNWIEMRNALSASILSDIKMSEKKIVYLKINKYFNQKKNLKILDFGCGNGRLVTYLHFLGYEHVYGVDVFPQTKNINFLRKLGIEKTLFFEYDKKSLPFRDASFDLVISEQVLEHVFDIDCYYRETSRILKDGGLAYFNFPHRMIPFDSHSRTWFIHYFPNRLRAYLFRIIGKEYQYYEKILNYKTIKYHKSIASKFFSVISEETKERFLSFDNEDLKRYEGNIFMRSLADRLMKAKIVGSFLVPVFCKISNVDLCLIK